MRTLAPAAIACSFIHAITALAIAEKITLPLIIFLSIITALAFLSTFPPRTQKNEP